MKDLTIRPVVPAEDAPLIHAWATEERARFWGMGDYSLADVLEVYEFLDGLSTHHAYLVHAEGDPVALFQTYEPAADPVGEFYDVEPGDFGVHLMIGPAVRPVPGFTAEVFGHLAEDVFSVPPRRRIVVEPDARNTKALDRFERLGFVPGARIELPHKPAQLGFLTRERWEGRNYANESGPEGKPSQARR